MSELGCQRGYPAISIGDFSVLIELVVTEAHGETNLMIGRVRNSSFDVHFGVPYCGSVWSLQFQGKFLSGRRECCGEQKDMFVPGPTCRVWALIGT